MLTAQRRGGGGASCRFGSWLIINNVANTSSGAPYTGGDVIMVFFAVVMASFHVGQVAPAVTAFNKGRASARRIFEVVDRVPPIDIHSTAGERPDKVKGDIALRGVSFSYPARREAQIFDGLDLDIAAGTTVALVGSSGSGKSTVIQLVSEASLVRARARPWAADLRRAIFAARGVGTNGRRAVRGGGARASSVACRSFKRAAIKDGCPCLRLAKSERRAPPERRAPRRVGAGRRADHALLRPAGGHCAARRAGPAEHQRQVAPPARRPRIAGGRPPRPPARPPPRLKCGARMCTCERLLDDCGGLAA